MQRQLIIFSSLVLLTLALPGCYWTGQPIDLRCVDDMHKGQDDVKPIAGEKKEFPKAKNQEQQKKVRPKRKMARASSVTKARADELPTKVEKNAEDIAEKAAEDIANSESRAEAE